MRVSKKAIGLIYWDSGYGILRDVCILDSLLSSVGFIVKRIPSKDRRSERERRLNFLKQIWRIARPLDIQFHLEQIHREQFLFSLKNYIIPNPEFTDPKVLKKLRRLSGVCCKTRIAVALFKQYTDKPILMGFTSLDQYMPNVTKDYRKVLHIAGKSDYKGTKEILNVWRRHPEWPELNLIWGKLDSYQIARKVPTVAKNINLITRYLPETELRLLQNQCGIHLCPSRTEGFGHYLAEGLSTCGVVVTTDAPPMNELVDSQYGFLVAAKPERKQYMSCLYSVDESELEEVISGLLKMDHNNLQQMGMMARKWFLKNKAGFEKKLISIANS